MTISTTKNIFRNIPNHLADEFFETLLKFENVTIERIVSEGHHNNPGQWYFQKQNEWILLIQGEAMIEIENSADLVALQPGDCYFIPSKTRHRVIRTSEHDKTIWLAIHIYPA